MFRHRIIDSRFFSSCFRATRPVLSFLLSSFSLRPSLILTDARTASGPGQIEAPPDFAGAPRSPYGLRPQFFDSFVHASWKKLSNFGIYYKLSLTIYIYIYELVDERQEIDSIRSRGPVFLRSLSPPPRNGERCADEDIDR